MAEARLRAQTRAAALALGCTLGLQVQAHAPSGSRQQGVKVAIVGHTDNQGSVDTNVALSQRRAEAVVAALVHEHRIDAGRLRARSVANFAPVSTNTTEAGRAKNRRVELMEQ